MDVIAPEVMPAAIAQAIVDVMGTMGKLARDQHNNHGGFKYTSVDSFYQAVGPACAAAGLFIKPVCLGREAFEAAGKNGARRMMRLTFRFRFVHASGAMWTDTDDTRFVEVDQTGAQAFGAAESYALKSFLRSLFMIPTGEADADAAEQLETEVRKARVKAEQKAREIGEDALPFDLGNGMEVVPVSELSDRVRAHLVELADVQAIRDWAERNKHGRDQLHAAHKGLAVGLKRTVEEIVRSLQGTAATNGAGHA